MSGTLSRLAGRFDYAPTLRVNPVMGSLAPGSAGALGVDAMPVRSPSAPLAAGMAGASGAGGGGGGVSVGSFTPDRPRQDLMDGAGGSAQGAYGGPGPSGAPSTGSFVSDLAGFGRSGGLAALGMTNPMGIAGFGLGALAAGFANAIGAPQTADAIARGIGLEGPVGAFMNEAPGFGELKGAEDDPGLVSAENPLSGLDGAGIGGDPADNANSNSDAQGQSGLGNDGTGAGGAGMGAGAPGNDGEFMRGGYTGHGHPAEPAGTVHRGEVVIPAASVQQYGIAPLLMLARGQVPPSRLAALLA
jgi:hypothetical protein